MKRNVLIGMLMLTIASLLMCFPAGPALSAEGEISYIIKLKEPPSDALSLFEEASSLQEICGSLGLYTLRDPDDLEYLRENGLLEYAEPDYEVTLFAQEDVNGSVDLWHLEMLGSSEVTEFGCFGQWIRVGIIDSGAINHADLEGNLLPGYNYLTDSEDVTDNIGHGTFVAGLIAALDNGQGVTGIAPHAKIVPLKCFDANETTRVSTICRAIYDAVDTYGCDLINMSFGVKSYSQTLESAINHAYDNGVISVASVGNLGNTEIYYPAAFSNVIGVGAVDSQSELASFSQTNSSVFVVAPGKAVYSTNYTGGYATKNGTSFSAPLVAGCIARLLNVDPALTPQTVADALAACAADLGDAGYDTSYGYGMVSLPDTIQYLLEDQPYFLAPFLVNGEDLQIKFINFTEETFTGQCYFQEFNNGLMVDITFCDIVLEPGGVFETSFPRSQYSVKCCVWRSLSDISAITNYRECEGTS